MNLETASNLFSLIPGLEGLIGLQSKTTPLTPEQQLQQDPSSQSSLYPTEEPGEIEDPEPDSYKKGSVSITDVPFPPPIQENRRFVSQAVGRVAGEFEVDEYGRLLEKFFEMDSFAGDVIESYNNWTRVLHKQIQAQAIDFDDGSTIKISRIHMTKPTIDSSKGSKPLTPIEARTRQLTYAASISAVLSRYVRDKNGNFQEVETSAWFHLIDIPVMLGSIWCVLHGLKDPRDRANLLECPADPLGYFIIDGAEKVIMLQENLRSNRFFIYLTKIKNKNVPILRMTSVSLTEKSTMSLIKGITEDDSDAIKIQLGYLGGNLKTNPTLLNVLAIFQLFSRITPEGSEDSNEYAFFGEDDTIQRMILQFVKPENRKKVQLYLIPTIIDFRRTPDPINTIATMKQFPRLVPDKPTNIKDIRDVKSGEAITIGVATRTIIKGVSDSLFPHMKYRPNDILHRLQLLSLMIARFTEHLAGLRDIDDRDSWTNKRLETPGFLLERLFHDIWKSTIGKIRNEVSHYNKPTRVGTYQVEVTRTSKGEFEQRKKGEPEPEPFTPVTLAIIQQKIQYADISKQMKDAFSPNAWGAKNQMMKKRENITDILQRQSLMSVYSHLHRINTPTSKRVKQLSIRMVQMSQVGFVDIFETPEGAQCKIIGSVVSVVSNGSNTESKIEDLKDGDEVLTVDPITFETRTSKIFNHFVKESGDKKVYKITSLSGRETICTEDHPFLTGTGSSLLKDEQDSNKLLLDKGWTQAKDLKVGKHLILISPQIVPMPHVVKTQQLIIDDAMFEDKLEAIGIKRSLIQKYTDELTDMGLLPLYNDHEHLPLISRIAGYLLADGSMSLTHVDEGAGVTGAMCFGTEYDGELFFRDYEKIGWSRGALTYVENTMTCKFTGRETTHHAWVTHVAVNCCALLLALDITYGKRTRKPSKPVPAWILTGSQAVKREFLSGFQGGDGNKMRAKKRKGKKNAYGYKMGPTQQTKHFDHLDSAKLFMNQMRDLLIEFGIEMYSLNVEQDKYDKDLWLVQYNPSNAETNLIRYMDLIGFRYATTKSTRSYYIVEYLKYKHQKIEERNRFKETVFDLYDNKGIKPTPMSKMLGVELRKVTSILDIRVACIKAGKWNNNATLPDPKGLITPEQWFSCTTAYNNLIAMPIASIEPHPACLVSDFTTESDDHTFIANGFVTHNCGLVKHKALTCYVSHDVDETAMYDAIVGAATDEDPDFHQDPQAGLSTVMDEEHTSPCLLNGKFLGWVAGEYMMSRLIQIRRNDPNKRGFSIVLDADSVLFVHTDACRPTRPLLVVNPETNTLIYDPKTMGHLNFYELIQKGAIEYIDAWDQSDLGLDSNNRNRILIAQQGPDLVQHNATVKEAMLTYELANARLLNMIGVQSQDNEKGGKQEIDETIGLGDETNLPTPPVIPKDPTQNLFEEQKEHILRFLPTRIEIEGKKKRAEALSDSDLITQFYNAVEMCRAQLNQSQLLINELEKRRYTHCELDPTAILGLNAAIIPLSNSNVGTKNTFQCLPPSTPVLVEGKKWKPIGDLKNGESVMSVNPESGKAELTSIHSHFTIDPTQHGKDVYTIQTESGRQIQATGDHPFLTDKGFVPAEQLTSESKVAVYDEMYQSEI